MHCLSKKQLAEIPRRFTVRIEMPSGRIMTPQFCWPKDAYNIARVYRNYGAKATVTETP